MKTPNLQSQRQWLGERAFQAARQTLPETQKARTEIARKHLRAGHTLKQTVAEIATVVAAIHTGRRARTVRCDGQASWYARHCHATTLTRSEQPQREVHGPDLAIPLRQRFKAWQVRQRAEAAARAEREERERTEYCGRLLSSLLSATRTDTRRVTRLPKSAAFTDATARAWTTQGDAYSRKCTYRKTYANFSAAIPHDYNERIRDQYHLSLVHDLVTLNALPVATERPDEEAFRARWVRKSAGFSFVVEDGFILRRGNEITHGSTLGACRSQLTRRENEAKLDQLEANILRKLETHQLNEFSPIEVTFADSDRAGNCHAGTAAFRDRHFAGRETATVTELCDVAEKVSERRYVYAACLQAIRRVKKAELLSHA